MSRFSLAALTAAVLALMGAAGAVASPWPFKDPRVCGYPYTKSQCVAGRAEIAVVRHIYPKVVSSFKCQTLGPLKAQCPTSSAAGQVVYTVVFSKSAAGRWWVKVTP